MVDKDSSSLHLMSGCEVPPSGCLVVLISQRLEGKQLLVSESLTYVPQAGLCPDKNLPGLYVLKQKSQP